MLHVKFENCRSSGLTEDVLMRCFQLLTDNKRRTMPGTEISGGPSAPDQQFLHRTS